MRRIIFYVLICIFVLSGVSVARDRGKSIDVIDLPRGKWWRTPEVANELNISPDERAKLDDLYYEKRNQMIDLKGNVKKERLELERIIENKSFDESASMNQFQKVLNAYNKLSIERYNYLIEVRKILGYKRFLQLKPKYYELRKEKSRKDNGRRESKR